MRIAVLDDYHRIAHRLADWEALDAETTFFDAPGADLTPFDVLVLMRERTPLPAETIDGLPNLKLVVTTGLRNAAVDHEALQRRGITYTGTGMPGYGQPIAAGGGPEATDGNEGVQSTVELAWALILALYKRIPMEDRALRTGVWQEAMPTNLAGQTLGLLGLGRLGAQMAAPAHAFGMRVIAWSENLDGAKAQEAGAIRVTKDELLERSDVVSIHLQLSDRTRGLISGPELDQMKDSAFLVNTSRGPIVDEAALVAGLRAGLIAGAGLDVYGTEPLPPDSPLLGLENAVLTPHIGYVSEDAFTRMYGEAVENIAAWQAGNPVRVIG